MRQFDEFEKQHKFETKRLVDYVFKALAAGESVISVKKDLVYKGVTQQDAEYVVDYIYRQKRWQIAWQRVGGGVRLVAIGLGNILVALVIGSLGFFGSRLLSAVFTSMSGWLGTGLVAVATIMLATGIITTLWGAFQLLTASSDSMKGCLTAAIVGFVIFLLAVVGYLLVTLL